MRLSRRNFFMRPPPPGLRKRDIDGATNRDVSQPIKPTALEQSVLFTWPACDDGGFGKRLRVAWLLAPPAWLSKEE